MNKIVIAIDGFSSCGKSSTAKKVAENLNYAYIDTGAMYRAVTLYFLQNHVALSNPKEIEKALKEIQIEFRIEVGGKNCTFLNGLNVEEDIRKMYIADKVSEVSAITSVRKEMVAQQQKMGKKKKVVLDGRDIGTVVFPEAELKIFMTAEPIIRAQRRQVELLEKGEIFDLDYILQNLQKRDYIDTNREHGPLIQAEDAILIDTSYMTLDEQVEEICLLADRAIAHKLSKNGR